MAIETAIETFESKAKRVVWLPAITLGYIFTLSGSNIDFVMAVVAVAGAHLTTNVLTGLIVESDDGMHFRSDPFAWGRGRYNSRQALTMLFYLISIPYGLHRLSLYFTHTDLLLVSLAGIYWGTLSIIVIQLDLPRVRGFRALVEN